MGTVEDFVDVVQEGFADSVAMAHVLHYDKLTVADIRRYATAKNVYVRRYEACPKLQ